MLVKTTDGTPDAVKVARPVWSGGKSGDNFKGLPITIGRTAFVLRVGGLHLVRSPRRGNELYYPVGTYQR
ncbi:MAG: hypothetical protein ACLTHF_15175, partial [Fusicatenibacter saccharivorans]